MHSFLALGGRTGFFKNRAKTDIIKRHRQLMLLGEAFYLLLTLSQAHTPGPDPRELRIIDSADLLLLQLGPYQIGKLTHEGNAILSDIINRSKLFQFIS